MIQEYALEPELVATWVERSVGRYFIENFGVGQPRIVSRYPKRWKKLVWEAFVSDNDLERERMTELLARLSEAMVRRRDPRWRTDGSWLENAEEEHARVPFHAILARSNPRGHAEVLAADRLDDTIAPWTAPRARIVQRRAAQMASAVASMLRNADAVILVDPYFGPENARHRAPLTEFLREIVANRPGGAPQRIEVQSSDRLATPEFFRTECERRLPGCAPPGVELLVVRLRERPGGERLHNRYILTDLGGVMFGVGLDEGNVGATDDVQLLDRAQYKERWRQYASETPAFDRPEATITIRNVRR